MTRPTDEQLEELARLEAGASDGGRRLRYMAAALEALPAILPELRLLRALADAMEALDAACTGEASAAVAGTLLAWQRWKGSVTK